MEDYTLRTKQSFYLALTNPKLIEDQETLQFSITLILEEPSRAIPKGEEKILATTTGWRIKNGKLLAPMRKHGAHGGYYAFWEFSSSRAEDVIRFLAREWLEKFPTVLFPRGGDF